MPLPAAARLVDFGLAANRRDGELGSSLPHRSAANVIPTIGDSATASEALLARARAEGQLSGRAEMESALARQEAAFEARLSEERAAWAEQEGAEIARRMEVAFGALSAGVQDAVAAILTPFLEEAARDRILGELAATLELLLSGNGSPMLQVSGPDDLLLRLRALLGSRSGTIRFVVTDAIDVKVVADRTVIETRLGAWLRRIRGNGG